MWDSFLIGSLLRYVLPFRYTLHSLGSPYDGVNQRPSLRLLSWDFPSTPSWPVKVFVLPRPFVLTDLLQFLPQIFCLMLHPSFCDLLLFLGRVVTDRTRGRGASGHRGDLSRIVLSYLFSGWFCRSPSRLKDRQTLRVSFYLFCLVPLSRKHKKFHTV